MSILNVDQISPIGSGSTITVTATETKTGDITIGTGTSIFSPAGNTLVLGTNNVERIRIKNDGKIGIGIAAPTSTLYVNGTSSNDVITARAADTNGISVINILAEGTTGHSRIKFSDTAGTDGQISYTHTDRALTFAAGGTTERLRIGSSGQIGLSGANYGTAGQVLTSQGSGSAVQWASPVIYTEYSSQTLSGANSYATTITGNPKIFEVSLYKLRTVASQNTMYRLSTSAGEITSGYHDISYAVRAGNSNISNAVRGSAQGQGCLTNYDFTNPDNLISGEARFTRVAAGLYTWQAMYDHRFDPSRSGGDANDQYLLNSKGHIADFSSSGSGIVTQFRIFTSGGGNFTSGTVTVRGIL